MIDVFFVGNYQIEANLCWQQGPLGVDQFTYQIGWFRNADDSIYNIDFINAIQNAGFTVVQEEVFDDNQYSFTATPGNQLTEVLARADAIAAINAVIVQLTALGY
jgi:hypothetical protein